MKSWNHKNMEHASVHNSFLEWLADMQFDFEVGISILQSV